MCVLLLQDRGQPPKKLGIRNIGSNNNTICHSVWHPQVCVLERKLWINEVVVSRNRTYMFNYLCQQCLDGQKMCLQHSFFFLVMFLMLFLLHICLWNLFLKITNHYYLSQALVLKGSAATDTGNLKKGRGGPIISWSRDGGESAWKCFFYPKVSVSLLLLSPRLGCHAWLPPQLSTGIDHKVAGSCE